MRIKLSSLIIACVVVTGCATTDKNNSSAVDTGALPAVNAAKNTASASIENNAAVKDLVGVASQQWASKDYASASVSLERAIRIAPREARLYYSLANVRFAQKNYTQAEQLCKKAVSLWSKGPSMQARCQKLIARAKQAKG
jgi:Tfp pilus assembly protein PilF